MRSHGHSKVPQIVIAVDGKGSEGHSVQRGRECGMVILSIRVPFEWSLDEVHDGRWMSMMTRRLTLTRHSAGREQYSALV